MSHVSQNPALSAARPLDVAGRGDRRSALPELGIQSGRGEARDPEIPPLIQAAIRSAGAGLIVWLWTRARRIPLHLDDGSLPAGLLAGVLFGIEFVLVYRGLLFTNASRAVLFLYTAPFFVVLGSRWLIPGDHFQPSQWLGLVFSFAGIAVAFGIPSGGDPRRSSATSCSSPRHLPGRPPR
jgi:drug/metabolite transporter (DMT)-like permease